MLNRKPTRIELKAEDKEEVRRGAEGAMCLAVARLTRCSGCCCAEQRCRSEFHCWVLLRTTAARHRPVPPQYEAVRAERQQAQLQAAAAAAGKAPLSPLFTVRRPAVGGWSGWGEKRRRLACAPSCCIPVMPCSRMSSVLPLDHCRPPPRSQPWHSASACSSEPILRSAAASSQDGVRGNSGSSSSST